MNPPDTETPESSRPDPVKAKEHGKLRTARNTFHPLKLFTDNAWAARLWFLIALMLLGWVVIQPFFIINAYRTRERVVIMDGAGTYSIAPTLDFESATHLHEELALWATYALFSQNPNGFDMPELNGSKNKNLSELASPETFGHLGFTGTSVWVDPKHELTFIFLSNRTYPDMDNWKLNKENFRPRIQDVVYHAIGVR